MAIGRVAAFSLEAIAKTVLKKQPRKRNALLKGTSEVLALM